MAANIDTDQARRWAAALGEHPLTLIPTTGKRPAIKWADLPVGEKVHPFKDDHDGLACILRGSGLVVLDVDMPHGDASLDDIVPDEGIPETLTVRTTSGGRHYYFTLPEGTAQLADKIGFRPSLDFKAYGYVIAPGSSGYKVTDDAPPAPAPAPGWLLDAVRADRASAPREVTAAGAGASHHTMEDLAALAKGKRGPEWTFLRSCAAGALPCRVAGGEHGDDLGPVDRVFFQAMRELAAAWPDMDADQVVDEVLAPSAATLEAQDALQGNATYTLEDWRAKLTRALRQVDRSPDIFEGLIPPPPEAPPEWAVYPHATSNTVYVANRETGEYTPVNRVTLISALKERRYPVHVPTKNGERLMNIGELIDNYETQLVNGLVLDMADPAIKVGPGRMLHVPSAPRPDIEPRESAAVGGWLDLLIPDKALRDVVRLWLGTFGALDNAQPAVWFTGSAGSGKTLFANACAELWGQRAPTSGSYVMSRFNADVARCPVVYFDEDFPKDARGAPRIQDFKTLVNDRARSIEQKHQAQVILNGALRVILSSNHFGLVTRASELQPDDVAALQRRIIHVDVKGDAAGQYLAAHDVQGWRRSGELASHFRWIEESYRNTAELRGRCPDIVHKLKTSTTASASINTTLASWLEEATPTTEWGGVAVRDGAIVCSPRALARVMGATEGVRAQNQSQLAAALTSMGSRRSVRVSEKVGARRVFVLDMAMFMRWAEDNGDDPTHLQERIDRW